VHFFSREEETLTTTYSGTNLSSVGTEFQEELVLIYDPKENRSEEPTLPHYLSSMILLVSPNLSHFKTSLKQYAFKRILPLHSLSELLIEAKYFGLSKKDLKDRFKFYGGIPRFIFHPNQHQIQQEVMSAIGQFALDKESHWFTNKTIPQANSRHPSHKVIHAVVGDDFMETSINFNSKMIADQVFQQEWMRDKQELFRLAKQFRGAAETRVTAGNLYDGICKELLSFRPHTEWKSDSVFHLSWGNTGLNFPKPHKAKSIGVVCWKDLEENVFYVPTSSTFPLADLLLRIGDYLILFNATLSEDHPIKFTKLQKAIPDFPWDPLPDQEPNTNKKGNKRAKSKKGEKHEKSGKGNKTKTGKKPQTKAQNTNKKGKKRAKSKKGEKHEKSGKGNKTKTEKKPQQGQQFQRELLSVQSNCHLVWVKPVPVNSRRNVLPNEHFAYFDPNYSWWEKHYPTE